MLNLNKNFTEEHKYTIYLKHFTKKNLRLELIILAMDALGLIALGMLNGVPHKGMPIQSLRMDPCLNRVFIIRINRRSYWIGVGPHPMTFI